MVENILLNILFLLLFLLFVPIILEDLQVDEKKKNVLKIVSSCFAIVACIFFPITIKEGVLLDLRYVATLIGGFYGGVIATIALWITNIIMRIIVGGDGVYATFVFATIHLIFILLFYQSFRRWSQRKRVLYISFFSLLTSIVMILFIHIILNVNFHFQLDLFFISMYTISTVIIVYMLELTNRVSLLVKNVHRAEKLDIVNHLASSIAHELRNPLTVVKGLNQLLLKKEKNEEDRKLLELSLEELNKSNTIIKNYLTFSKSAPELIEHLDVRLEILECIDTITPLAKMHSVLIQSELETDLWVLGEKQLLQQCFVNISQNCIEAMPNGGVLKISLSADQEKIIVRIYDTGVGMSEEQLARIGEPYFTTKGREGTGLGMLSAIRIIESMKGRLEVDSKIGSGTTFTIYLPLTQQPD